jgi:hypothetical protein
LSFGSIARRGPHAGCSHSRVDFAWHRPEGYAFNGTFSQVRLGQSAASDPELGTVLRFSYDPTQWKRYLRPHSCQCPRLGLHRDAQLWGDNGGVDGFSKPAALCDLFWLFENQIFKGCSLALLRVCCATRFTFHPQTSTMFSIIPLLQHSGIPVIFSFGLRLYHILPYIH